MGLKPSVFLAFFTIKHILACSSIFAEGWMKGELMPSGWFVKGLIV